MNSDSLLDDRQFVCRASPCSPYCELDFGHDDGRCREDRPKPATGCRQAPRERPRRSLRLKLVHEASTVPRSGCTIAERLAEEPGGCEPSGGWFGGCCGIGRKWYMGGAARAATKSIPGYSAKTG